MMDATPRTTFCNPPERGRGDAVRHPKNGKRRQPAWNLGSAAPCKNAEALRLKTDNLNEMQEYLQKVLKQMEAAVQTATNKYAHILSIAKQYVQNNYNRDISMDEVAEMVSMSYSYFSRVFKEQLHQSFSEYVLSVRMREAKRLMEEDPAIKIKEVAELVGYESVYTFSRAYKQYYHVSPKQDRDG